jgi:transposase-like protein
MLTQHQQKERFRKLISQRARSGLTISEFCKQHSVSEYQYYYWRVRIEGKRKQIPKKSSQSFLPIPLQTAVSPVREITITLPSSTTISLPAQDYQQSLPIILKTLSGGSSCNCK